MSSDEDEEPGRIAFGHEGDYEDGQWIGSEFYARSQRQGRVQTKEEALYGYEGSSDEEGGRRGKKGHQDESLRPIDFVKGKAGGVKRPRPGRPGSDDSDEGENGLGAGLGFGRRRSKGIGFQGGSSDEEEEEEEKMDVVAEEEEDEEEEGAPKAGLGARLEKAKGRVDVRVKGRAEVESKAKFEELLKEGGVSSASSAPANGKGQDFFRGVLKEAEDKVAAEEAKLKRKQALPVRMDKEAFSFENHTKGFASKFLAKFGFKGRLGKEEQGITKVPEVVVRPGRGGLGTMKEATQLRANREIEADLHGKELEENSDDEKKGGRRKREKETSKAEKLAGAGGWKKGGKKKRVVLSVEDVLRMEKEHDFVHEGEKKTVIVDMRGPQPKLLTRTDEINYDAEDAALTEDEPPKLGQELLHNVHLLVDLCESELFGLDKRVKHDQSRIDELEKQLSELDTRVEEGGSKVDRLSRVSALITRVEEKIKEKEGDVPMDAIIKVFRQLRETFWEEYTMFELWTLVPALVSPVMTRFLADWDPLADPQHVVEMLHKWKPVLVGGGDADGKEQRNPLVVKAGEAVFHGMAQKLVMPKIRTALLNRWQVRDVEPAVRLIGGLKGCVRPDDLEGLLTTIVMPKIAQAVSSWNPREDTVPIHAWIHPWLPLLGSRLSSVFPDIRRKLSQVLVEWHPSDLSAHVILSPWAGVFDNHGMEQLLLRSIMPKLVQALKQLVIDPNNQDLRPLQWVLQWRDLLSPFHLHSLLEGEFFPKWMHVLYAWLAAPGADFSEVADWFVGWKEHFPPDMLEDGRIAAQFNHALQAMNDTITHGRPLQPPLVSAEQQQSYYSVVEQRRTDVAAAARAAPPPPPAPSMDGLSISFKHMVELFAERNGVVLVPKVGRAHNGRQVYAFGGVNIYLDQDVVFAELGPAKTWTPTDLQALLADVQRRQA